MLSGGRPGSAVGTRRLTAAAAALLLVSVGALSACSADPDSEPGTSSGETAEPAAQTPDRSVVGEDGLTLELDGVTVEFPAGSATGAVVEAESVAATSAPGEAAGEDATAPALPLLPLTDGVTVSLDGGSTQPSVPVDVTFALPADLLPGPGAEETLDLEAEPTLAQAVAAGNVAFAVQSDDGTVDVVPATFDETTGTVSGQVRHFSGIWPVSIDVDAMVDTVLQTLGVTSERPDCEGKPATIGDETYTVISDPLMWMCVEPTSDGAGLVVTAKANAPFPFIGEPDIAPDADLGSAALSSGGVLTQLATEVLLVVPDGKVAVFPGGESTVTYAEAPGELNIHLEAAPHLLLLAVLAETGAAAFGMSTSAFAELVGGLDCMSEVGGLIEDAAEDGLTPGTGADISTAFFDCAGTVAELTPLQSLVASVFSAAPQLIIGGFWGAITELWDVNTLDIPIHVTGGSDPVTPAEFEPFLGTWSGPVDQPGSRYYGMEVTISMGADEKPTAQVHYPELSNCSGYWDSPILSGRTLEVVEHIETAGTSCVDEVGLRVRRVGDQLRYWTVGGYDARATLSRGPYEPPTSNEGATWPVGADEGPPALTMWLGANLYAFPEWVACDDARDWCLVGGTTEHMLVQLDGLSDRGRVPDASPDPVAAMVRLGAPRASAVQIMG